MKIGEHRIKGTRGVRTILNCDYPRNVILRREGVRRYTVQTVCNGITEGPVEVYPSLRQAEGGAFSLVGQP